ncbi:MAG: hypothetical protein Q7S59_01465 [Sulfurimonas sp.]|nr:hypothetical protein [Sulfurimonas sp.]
MSNLIMMCFAVLLLMSGCGDEKSSQSDAILDSNIISHPDANATIYSHDDELKSIGRHAAPPMYISIEDPAPNAPVTVEITGVLGSSMYVTVAGSGCGTLQNTVGVSPLTLAGNAGSSGYCIIKATYDDGKRVSGRFVVAAHEPNLPPIDSEHGTWVIGEKPQVSTLLDSDAKRLVGLPVISKIEGSQELINGGSSEFTVYSSSGSNIAAILVQIGSYDGYYAIPVYSSSKNGEFKLLFASDLFTKLRAVRAAVDLNITITVIDDLNQVSEAFTILLSANEIGFRAVGSAAKVSGKVSYEDFPVSRIGLGSSRMLPVRFAEVQVVRNFDNATLAIGATDASGRYEISFQNDDTEHSGYYVLVYARQDSIILKQEVRDFSRNVYSFKSGSVIDEIQTPQKSDMDIAIEKSNNAGAMNIFDVGVSCSDYARLHGGRVPDKLTFFWQVNGISGSYFSPLNREIVILGKLSDSDEYDDLVIGHEYGHFVMSTYSKSSSPGGSHTLAPSVPALAWSEGWATYFSAAALNKSYYVDTTATGVGAYYSIESLPSSITLGNIDGKLEGSLSEAVVSSVLWDLYDSTNETFDTLSDKSIAIWKIFTTYLNGVNFRDRGESGIDLVDFLDGWFCLGYGDKGSDGVGMVGNVWSMHALSYDFKELDACK